ncbi:type IV toxin-antitoxin system AbiEi family antitoxin domain-containing protein [Kytococcus sedentarius]|uniref:type IV toxin-antitoxin system AbiEi family antitoxin domain-containing protein n=1 Tax=Kytococcus sedentarius TaxID=1276 RepID=UPI00387A1170
MRARDALTTLSELGTEQDGLVTTARAGEFGVTPVDLKRLADHGHITRLRRGVYALPSAPHGHLQELRSAWLEASGPSPLQGDPPDTVISHLSAAAVHGLGEVIPRQHEFTSPRRRQTVHDDVRFHRATLATGEHTVVQVMAVTSVPRTLEDLARTTSDLDHFAVMVKDAFSVPAVGFGSLLAALDASAPHFGLDGGEELMTEAFQRAGMPPGFERAAEALRAALAPIIENLTRHLAPASSHLRSIQQLSKALDEAVAPWATGLEFLRDERFRRPLHRLATAAADADDVARAGAGDTDGTSHEEPTS